jgi:hypothetical protein
LSSPTYINNSKPRAIAVLFLLLLLFGPVFTAGASLLIAAISYSGIGHCMDGEVLSTLNADASQLSKSGMISSNTVLNLTAFAGDFSTKVNACLTALFTAGGTCDARGLTYPQNMTTNITCGDGTHAVTLLLPATTITRAIGVQLVYDNYCRIVGAGSADGTGTTITGNDAVAAIRPFDAHGTTRLNRSVHDVYIGHLNISQRTIRTGSIGLEIGGPTGVHASDVSASKFEDIRTSGSDEGVHMDGPDGCTCYNVLYDVWPGGHSYGARIINSGPWRGTTVNQNSWYGGRFNGAIGIYEKGGMNKYYGIDMEGDPTHGMELAGQRALFVSPYEERNGKDVIDPGAAFNMVESPEYWRAIDTSGNATNFTWGSDNAPLTIGVQRGLVFGAPSAYDDHYNSAFTLLGYGDPYYDLDMLAAGSNQSTDGRYRHVIGLRTGLVTDFSGIASTGRITSAQLATPLAPAISQGGTRGNTQYSYYVVCHDRNAGVTLPSPKGSTDTGNAMLNITNYNVIAWNAEDGCFQWDILKNNTSTALATLQSPSIPVGHNIIHFRDTGQPTHTYQRPARNTTGDMAVSGMSISNGIGWPLPQPAINGASFYCPNCDAPANPPSTCSSNRGKTGSWVHGLNNQWICVP